VDKENKKHKKTATAIFDDSVCFKINLKEENEDCEQSTRTPDEEIELPEKDNCDKDTTQNVNESSSMLKKLSLFKSKPRLFLFHSHSHNTADASESKEDVNMSKGIICNTSENLMSRNKLF
jgi:hypothetical protein